MRISKKLLSPVIPVSWGELVDKITILEIKKMNLKSRDAKDNVRKEFDALMKVAGNLTSEGNFLFDLKSQLYEINQTLWDLEDAIRLKEAASEFDSEFVQLARSVYITNDKRARVKREISLRMNSDFLEEKSYEPY